MESLLVSQARKMRTIRIFVVDRRNVTVTHTPTLSLVTRQVWVLIVLLVGLSGPSAAQWRNTLGLPLTNIPAGHFIMGNSGPEVETSETPAHRVDVPAFQMGTTEVTLGQFKRFIHATQRHDLLTEAFHQDNRFGDHAPVVQVSWDDAQAFIAWLNRVDGGGWRLPSEAEWEYACRAGQSHLHCGSDNVREIAWFDGNSGGHQHPVGTRAPNAWGLHDMSGNVWEWVEDCWHRDYTDAPTDGSAWTQSCDEDWRGLRGGSWYFASWYTRAAIRFISGTPTLRNYFVGFRLARSLPPTSR